MRKSIDTRLSNGLQAGWELTENALLKEATSELEAYFAGRLKKFSTPLKPVGTDFQITVWNALMEIPYGEMITYLDLARKLNKPGAVRAVASANGANALSIFIPCHRVVSSDGSLKGYAGGLDAKARLLKLEGALLSGQLSIF